MILRGELDLSSGLVGPLLGLLCAFELLFVLFLAVFVAPVETDGRFEHEEDIIAGSFDFTDRLRDSVRLGKGIVDRGSQFLHELLQWLFHRVLPLDGCAASGRRSTLRSGASTPFRL